MDLNLTPVFYHQVSPLSPNTMKVLPSSTQKSTQKIVVGDQNGVLTVFGMKKGDSQIVFKTLPGPPISNVQLSGQPGTLLDKIFISCGAEVRAYTKKGKQFLKFDTNLTESIRTMWVEGSHLFTAGSYVYNHYVDCNDTDYFLSSDTINSVLHISSRSMAVIACQDCALRVLKDSNLLYELEVAGPPSSMTIDQGSEDGDGILYGTQDGRLGLVKLQRDAPEYCWDMINENKYGGINCIACYDICGTGVPDIILGRADGIVEIFSMDDSNQPRIQFTHMFGESIVSVAGGRVSSSSHPEVIVATYSGKIYGLVKGSAHKINTTISDEVKIKIETLKEEVSKMESQLTDARSNYQTLLSQGGPSVVSALPQFFINDSFTLMQDEAWYSLAIETQAPLDFVILQSNVPIDLEEVEKSSAVISYTEPDIKNGNYLLATCRCNETNRLEVKVRSIEGQYGTLQAYVATKLEPKSAQLRYYQIKPLSLHQRAHTFEESFPGNVLEIKGDFTLSDVHSWVNYCLPDVPDRPLDGEVTVLQYKSQYTGTQLQCVYRQGYAKFISDNLSTITVIKEVLSKEATKKKIQVNTNHVINEESIPHMLKLIHPKLEGQMMLAKNIQLIEPLKELQIHEGDISFLAPQCQYILDHAELMQKEIKRQPAMIDRYYALITDLFMDRASFKGQNAKTKVPDLLKLLDNCDLEELIEFFNSNL